VIEAELKARLCDPYAVRAALDKRASAERAIYHDIYFDTDDERLAGEDREVRLRTIETPDIARHLLTYKEPAVDAASGSKPEYETTVATPSAIVHLLAGLGYHPSIELTKDCENYELTASGRRFLATVVQVPEIDGVFVEVETMTEPRHLEQALADVRALMAELGVDEGQLTTELYTDAVRDARRR
jgi:adenylate cyclase class 2